MVSIKIWNWLKPSEVYNNLKFYSQSQINFISAFDCLPQSGDIFFIQKLEFKRWKQDGHNYISRKHGMGTREDREKYYFESEVIICTYVHGSGLCPNCKNSYQIMCSKCSMPITSMLFHRRAYWLSSNPDIILVHYLDDSQKSLHLDTDTSSLSAQSTAEEQIRRLEEVLKQIDFEQISPVQILEYSPDWGDVCGGCKILICIDPPLVVPNPQNLYCIFGTVFVHTESVQLGVLKCFAPPHSPGVVDFYLVYEGLEITQSRKEFEYKEIMILKHASIKSEWWEKDNKEITNELVQNIKEDLKEEYIEENFDEGFFLTQFRKIVSNESWERIHQNGAGYLHYLCALGFNNVIKILSPYIKNPNIKDFGSKTPIEIALCKHYYDCAYELIKLGAREIENTSKLGFKHGDSLNDRIQMIQSHVRAWLQQKQFRNLKRAAKTLQKTFRGMIVRKNFKYQKQAAIIIQKSVRKWLVSTYHS